MAVARKTFADLTHAKRHAEIRARARVQFDRWALGYDRSRLNELIFLPTIRLCQEEIARWQKQCGGGPYALLDVGCGTGRLVATLAADPDARRLVGLDFSPVMIDRLRRKIAGAPEPQKLEAVPGDAEQLPFPDAAFDVVTCCNSFHHYPHQAAVVREFYRVLRPGGLLLLCDGFRDNVIGWLIFDAVVASVERNVHHATWSEVRAMILDAGFATLRQRKVNVLAPFLASIASKQQEAPASQGSMGLPARHRSAETRESGGRRAT